MMMIDELPWMLRLDLATTRYCSFGATEIPAAMVLADGAAAVAAGGEMGGATAAAIAAGGTVTASGGIMVPGALGLTMGTQGALGAASMGMSALSGISGIMGAQQSASAKSAAERYQAQVAANNATIANQNATTALQAGQAAEAAQRMKTAGLIGSQRAGLAANGVQLNSGSALDVQSDAASLGELDALTIRSNAARTAAGYEAQAGNSTAQSQLDQAQAGWADTTGTLNSAVAGLSSASSVSDKWMKAYQGGTYNGLFS